MSTPILPTKLYIPTPHPGNVTRPHLIQQVGAGRENKLILLSAPAGYGKTTLLAEWISHQDIPICWVSLDAQDNDLKRFFSYLTAALRSIEFPVSENILTKLDSQEPEATTDFLSHLVNQIAATDQPAYLVLDDYHRITNPDVHQSVNALLENLPRNLHLVIATRSDPVLRLAKLRAHGELCEIRADDLRFSLEESIEYFNDRMKLGLSQPDIATLIKKTEGWIVGLQLASISLQEHPDKHQFVCSFAGDDRYIADYLFDEAFNRQSEHIQSFLLHTSILDRFNASLCDTVTQRNGGQTILSELDRNNLFLVPLDNQRNWYRYHHLFSELLQDRLKQVRPEIIPDLHTQASLWFEENNLLADSITHAVAADLIDRVVALTEEMAVHRMYAGELTSLITWLDQQPEQILRKHPWLLVARAWAFMNTANLDAVLPALSQLETILSNQSYPPELIGRIQGHIYAIRAYYGELTGSDPESFVQEAEKALQLLTDKDIHLRSFTAIRLANGLSFIGDLTKAIQLLREAGNASKLAGDGQLAVNALSEMAILQMVDGQLKQAHQDIIQTKDFAESLAKKKGRKPASMGVLYRHLSNIKYELDKLEEAKIYARQAVESCQERGEKEALYIAYVILAKAYRGLGEIYKFESTLDQGMRLVQQIYPSGVAAVINFKNHMHLLEGRTKGTEIWVKERELSIDDDFDYTRRLEYQNFTRLLAAQGQFSQALQVINKILQLIESAGAGWHWLRAKIIQAKIYQSLNEGEKALEAIEAALDMAQPEGYIRSFVDEGEAAAQLLYQAAQEGIHPEYCQMLLERFDLKTKAPLHTDLVEPLSERELEVLLHIAQGRSNQEIAEELIVSLYTVKSHARNIFGKLGVKNRTEAVAKARLYGLLPDN